MKLFSDPHKKPLPPSYELSFLPQSVIMKSVTVVKAVVAAKENHHISTNIKLFLPPPITLIATEKTIF
jgi:hypothetical protein